MTKRTRPGARGRRRVVACVWICLPLLLAAKPSPAPSDPVPVHVAGIQAVGPDQVVLLLADEKEEKAVPIAVGRDQGLAIFLGKERAQTPRPMTHDLIVEILKDLGATVEKVTITELKDDTYYAEIALRSGVTLHPVDARPSDAIALAVRLRTPIFAAPGLLQAPAGPDKPPGIPARLRAPGFGT